MYVCYLLRTVGGMLILDVRLRLIAVIDANKPDRHLRPVTGIQTTKLLSVTDIYAIRNPFGLNQPPHLAYTPINFRRPRSRQESLEQLHKVLQTGAYTRQALTLREH